MSTQWDYRGVTRVRLQRKVSLAVQVMDDFTGQAVTSADVRVEAAQLLTKPVRKGDGYFIFLDSPEPVLDITVRSWAYHPAAMRVDLTQLTRLNPVVKVRLTPNRSCPIPPQTTCLEGLAPAGSTLQVFCENDPRPLRLLYDYQCSGPEEGRFIQLFDPAGNDFEGRSFVLLRKDYDKVETFTVNAAVYGEAGGCLMAAPLSRDCKKAGTTVLPVMTVQTGESGAFFLPIRAMAVKTCLCRVVCTGPDGVRQERSVELEPGKVTRMDLTTG